MLVNYCLRKTVTTWGTQIAEVPQDGPPWARFPHDAPPDAIELARADANGHGLLDAQLEAASTPKPGGKKNVAINLDFFYYSILGVPKRSMPRERPFGPVGFQKCVGFCWFQCVSI